jgi:hypothetical protein
MKRRLDENTVKRIYRALVERFGEPIGKAVDAGPGVADERGGHPHKGKDPGNYGWGESSDCCNQCGGMMELDEDCCSKCGMMDQGEAGGRHLGHAAGCTCPDCARPEYTDRLGEDDELDQKAPPGREKQVKALKKDKDIDNPWAVAWASYNRGH